MNGVVGCMLACYVRVVVLGLSVFMYNMYLLCVVWCPGQNKRIAFFFLSFFHGYRKRRLKD
jgi:hypothetical protein